MPSPEPTILTRWGRLTGAQWQEARHREAMDAWWTPDLLDYVVENWPSPEQLATNRRHWAQKKRADRVRPRSGFQAQSTTPTQLAIL